MQLRGKAEAKELPSPLKSPNPYDVRGGDTALLCKQSVAWFEGKLKTQVSVRKT